jgi:hypothetical protein
MSDSNRGTGVMDAVTEMAPALSGNPAAVWHAAREGTQQVASMLPDTMGLDHVRHFIRRHPVVSAAVAMAVGYYFLGGLFGRRRR